MKFIPCKYRYQAVKQMPECPIIKKVGGGYAGFKTIADYEIWCIWAHFSFYRNNITSSKIKHKARKKF